MSDNTFDYNNLPPELRLKVISFTDGKDIAEVSKECNSFTKETYINKLHEHLKNAYDDLESSCYVEQLHKRFMPNPAKHELEKYITLRRPVWRFLRRCEGWYYNIPKQTLVQIYHNKLPLFDNPEQHDVYHQGYDIIAYPKTFFEALPPQRLISAIYLYGDVTDLDHLLDDISLYTQTTDKITLDIFRADNCGKLLAMFNTEQMERFFTLVTAIGIPLDCELTYIDYKQMMILEKLQSKYNYTITDDRFTFGVNNSTRNYVGDFRSMGATGATGCGGPMGPYYGGSNEPKKLSGIIPGLSAKKDRKPRCKREKFKPKDIELLNQLFPTQLKHVDKILTPKEKLPKWYNINLLYHHTIFKYGLKTGSVNGIYLNTWFNRHMRFWNDISSFWEDLDNYTGERTIVVAPTENILNYRMNSDIQWFSRIKYVSTDYRAINVMDKLLHSNDLVKNPGFLDILDQSYILSRLYSLGDLVLEKYPYLLFRKEHVELFEGYRSDKSPKLSQIISTFYNELNDLEQYYNPKDRELLIEVAKLGKANTCLQWLIGLEN